ncbi:tellurite resistance protein TerC [Pseudonocardia ammonioxydans]|uniref:Tellurite resistance protein TerC n=1 Tax=Pseudonocardia ammonioxydans TaxID=260086 RepID=A0A1I5BGC0_PSUAM|nr:TerC family protein [Pseudonocardia ammonioxydans]SFN73717.1 tellurite resistance protein TerC [Pseudonocardia ammonioxydans]
MNVPLWVWLATIAAIIGMLAFDFIGHARDPHEPTLRESAIWSAGYIALALLFGVGVGVFSGWQYGGEYMAGWLTEKALSVDNLFVFLLIMTAFAVPRVHQQKVLLIGIAIAIVMRGAFIAVGAVIIERFVAAFYLFAIVLFWLAYSQIKEALSGGHDQDPADAGDTKLIRMVRKVLPTSTEYDGSKLLTRIDGKRMLTPMALVIVAIGLTDLLFAFDSIPAIFGLTQEPFLVFTANAFALLGLRQLYFLIGGLLERLIYLAHGLAVILAFIGVKLTLHALHENNVPFINGGQPVPVPEVPIWLSLLVITGTIAVAAVASLVVSRRRRAAGTDGQELAGTPGSGRDTER